MSDVTTEREKSSYVACPDCRTVQARDTTECSVCGLDLEWLQGLSFFRETLSFSDFASENAVGWQTCLRLQVVTRTTPTGLSNTGRDSVEVRIPGDEPYVLVGDEGTLEAILQHGASSRPLTLPAEVEANGVLIKCSRIVDESSTCESPVLSEPPLLEAIRMMSVKELRLGRSGENERQIPHPEVALSHAVLVRRPATAGVWIANVAREAETFVNQRSIRVRRLESGDFVQIGPFAWVFSHFNSLLVPVPPIKGVDISAHRITLGDRLGPVSFAACAGEFVAIIGKSGSGKSTLLHALAGLPRSRDSGIVSMDGRDIDRDLGWHRSLLGYVPQKAIVHHDLTAKQALEYSALLRGGVANERIVRRMLYQVELPESRWGAKIRNLSGGEERRVRTAAEMVTEPRILLADEPGSGLDFERERSLMKLLRSLGHQGCTVVVILHNLELLDMCDRVLALDHGQIIFQGTPNQFREHADPFRVREASPKERGTTDKEEECSEPDELEGDSVPCATFSTRAPAGKKQFKLLFQREWVLITQDWLRRLALPGLLVPLVFAFSLAVAIKPADIELLGFFSVLSCIWMGASLSVLSVCRERDVFNHERHLFLRIPLYSLAKLSSLAVLTAGQVVIFLVTLWLVRTILSAQMLSGVLSVMLALWLVAWTGLTLGYALSAAANESKDAASFVLPLIMIVQIVFSAPICVGPKKSLEIAYGQLNYGQCQVRGPCLRRASRWYAPEGLWLCDDCFAIADRVSNSKKLARENDLLERIREERKHRVERDSERARNDDSRFNKTLPNRLAALASFFTISRYGDIVLSTFAYDTEIRARRRILYGYPAWRWDAVFQLLKTMLLLFAFSVAVLWWQTTDKRSRVVACQRLMALSGKWFASLRRQVSRLSRSATSPPESP